MVDTITEEQGKKIISVLENMLSRLIDIQDDLRVVKLNASAIQKDVSSIEVKKSLE